LEKRLDVEPCLGLLHLSTVFHHEALIVFHKALIGSSLDHDDSDYVGHNHHGDGYSLQMPKLILFQATPD
jgi:hypothetical protein